MTKNEMKDQAREEYRKKLVPLDEEYKQDLKSALEKYEKAIGTLGEKVHNRLKEIDEMKGHTDERIS